MGLDRTKKTGGFFYQEAPVSGRMHYFKENRGHGLIIALCNRVVILEKIAQSLEDVDCKDCIKRLRESGILPEDS